MVMVYEYLNGQIDIKYGKKRLSFKSHSSAISKSRGQPKTQRFKRRFRSPGVAKSPLEEYLLN